jgi:hypothetical protein
MNKYVLYCDEMEDDVLELFGMTSKRNSGHGRAPSPRCEVARLRGTQGGGGLSQGGGNLRDMVVEWRRAVEKVYVGASGEMTQRAVEQRRGRCGGRERQVYACVCYIINMIKYIDMQKKLIVILYFC